MCGHRAITRTETPFKGRGAPGRPSACHSLATSSHSSKLQNGCSSASLKRLLLMVSTEHRSCGVLACPFAGKQTARTCRPSAAGKRVSRRVACSSAARQGGPRTPVRPAATRQHLLFEAQRHPNAQGIAAPASTGRPQAPLHVPLRGAGPGVELKAQRVRRRWTRARPCCAVAYVAEVHHTEPVTHTPPVAKSYDDDAHNMEDFTSQARAPQADSLHSESAAAA